MSTRHGTRIPPEATPHPCWLFCCRLHEDQTGGFFRLLPAALLPARCCWLLCCRLLSRRLLLAATNSCRLTASILTLSVLTVPSFVTQARRAFLLMDTNRDEEISRGELRMGLSAMGLRLEERKLTAAFADADADGSGNVDFDEFLEFLGEAKSEDAQAIKRSLLGVRA